MCVDGYWSRSKTVTGVVYDAGVDAGMFFNSANMPEALNTNMITEILCDGESGPFCNQANTGVNHVVEFEIVTAHFLCINNYWPLLEKEVDANGASTSGTSHMHVFDSITYYMPNGFAGAKHGEAGFSCPCTAWSVSSARWSWPKIFSSTFICRRSCSVTPRTGKTAWYSRSRPSACHRT